MWLKDDDDDDDEVCSHVSMSNVASRHTSRISECSGKSHSNRSGQTTASARTEAEAERAAGKKEGNCWMSASAAKLVVFQAASEGSVVHKHHGCRLHRMEIIHMAFLFIIFVLL